MQDYLGVLAMLWIGFNLFFLFYCLRVIKPNAKLISLSKFMVMFWQAPTIIANEVFGWKLPKWTGFLFWFAPFYIHAIYSYSSFDINENGWYFRLGNLVFLWMG